MARSDKYLWEKTLTQLEDLNAVANDNEEGTEETGLDTVERDRGGKSKLLNLKNNSHFLGYQKLFLFAASDAVAIFDWTEYWFCQF